MQGARRASLVPVEPSRPSNRPRPWVPMRSTSALSSATSSEKGGGRGVALSGDHFRGDPSGLEGLLHGLVRLTV